METKEEKGETKSSFRLPSCITTGQRQSTIVTVEPFFDFLKGRSVRDVKHEDRGLGVAVVHGRHGPESFLACCVPNLERHLAALRADGDPLLEKRGADGRRGRRRERAVAVAHGDRGLANVRGADDHDLAVDADVLHRRSLLQQLPHVQRTRRNGRGFFAFGSLCVATDSRGDDTLTVSLTQRQTDKEKFRLAFRALKSKFPNKREENRNKKKQQMISKEKEPVKDDTEISIILGHIHGGHLLPLLR
jgi:hypothetical protein